MIGLPKRQIDEEPDELREQRRNRFRILVCVDGSDESYEGIRYAAQIGSSKDCDIILLYVRPIDQGLRTGGLQVRVARQNMLEWGLELPGIQYLKRGMEMLVEQDRVGEEWDMVSTHTDVWGDPLGDNKIEYRHEGGRTIVLKLKTAPDPASGILDQYELGPYNLIIMGAPNKWYGGLTSQWYAGVAQKVAFLAPCSVMIAREIVGKIGHGHLVCLDGSSQSFEAVRRDAVLAHHCGVALSILSVAKTHADEAQAAEHLRDAKGMLAEMGLKVKETMIRVGDPVEQIVDVGSDYSVVAVSGAEKSRFRRMVKKSVAFSVMGSSETTVLNIR